MIAAATTRYRGRFGGTLHQMSCRETFDGQVLSSRLRRMEDLSGVFPTREGLATKAPRSRSEGQRKLVAADTKKGRESRCDWPGRQQPGMFGAKAASLSSLELVRAAACCEICDAKSYRSVRRPGYAEVAAVAAPKTRRQGPALGDHNRQRSSRQSVKCHNGRDFCFFPPCQPCLDVLTDLWSSAG